MADDLRDKFIDYIQDAHALVGSVRQMLDSMIGTTDDRETIERLTKQKGRAEVHERMLKDRLEALGAGTSAVSEAGAWAGGFVKSIGDKIRPDKIGKIARDAYITAHVEIAAHELLERLADRAGDPETAQVARTIRDDAEALADWVAARWDRYLDLTLVESGISTVGASR